MAINAETLLYALIGLVVITFILAVHVEWRITRLTKGASGKNLEEVINNTASEVKEIQNFKSELEKYLETVEKRLDQSIRGVSVTRFNAFKGIGEGGNQSFAIALMNEDGNGAVLSTLHSRERVGVFAKPIKSGKSEFELTEEEKTVIKQASQSLKF